MGDYNDFRKHSYTFFFVSYNSNIYLCGNYSFIKEIKKKYEFQKIFFDEW